MGGSWGHLELAEYLLKNGARSPYAVMAAALKNNIEALKLLASYGVSVEGLERQYAYCFAERTKNRTLTKVLNIMDEMHSDKMQEQEVSGYSTNFEKEEFVPEREREEIKEESIIPEEDIEKKTTEKTSIFQKGKGILGKGVEINNRKEQRSTRSKRKEERAEETETQSSLEQTKRTEEEDKTNAAELKDQENIEISTKTLSLPKLTKNGLIRAILQEDAAEINRYIQADKVRPSAILIAAKEGKAESIRLLSVLNPDQETLNKALQIAIEEKFLQTANQLIQLGADIHMDGDCLYWTAKEKGEERIINYLKKKDKRYPWTQERPKQKEMDIYKDFMNMTDTMEEQEWGSGIQEQRALIIHAIEQNDLDYLKKVIHSECVDENNGEGLLTAVSKNKIKIVEFFLNQGADIHMGDDQALYYAAYYGYLDIADLLIEQGANIHARNGQILLFPAMNYNEEMLRLLVEKGGFLDLESVIHFAISSENKNILELLNKNFDIHTFLDKAMEEAKKLRKDEIYQYLYSIAE